MMKNMAASVLGIIVGTLIFFSWVEIEKSTNTALPLSDWVIINRLEIPPTIRSDNLDTNVIFDVEVKKNIETEWTSKIVSVSNPSEVLCEKSGSSKYVKGDSIRSKTIETMLGGCVVPSGEYFIVYDMKVELQGYGHKKSEKTSNVFRVE
jgi:hypothetical protein